MTTNPDNELQVCQMVESVVEKYFPELKGQVTFRLERGKTDEVSGCARLGLMEVVIIYGDDRVVEPKYRYGLIPLIAHELAHLVNPVAPDDVLRQRLPPEMFALWETLEGKVCSIGEKKG